MTATNTAEKKDSNNNMSLLTGERSMELIVHLIEQPSNPFYELVCTERGYKLEFTYV